MKSGPKPIPIAARFWRHVDKSDECWIWTGGRLPSGYGFFEVGTHKQHKKARAHRLSWELTNGAIPLGLSVLHRCDNPSCVRPTHLFLGTQSDNIKDMYRKGRSNIPRGERRHGSKLTETEVAKIKAQLSRGLSVWVISKATGHNYSTIAHIKTGRNWNWVSPETVNAVA